MKAKWGFSIGDRVVMIKESDPDGGVHLGMTGTVCDTELMQNNNNIGVRWDIGSFRFHDCNSQCESDHGWYVPYTSISHLVPDLGEISEMSMSIDELFV